MEAMNHLKEGGLVILILTIIIAGLFLSNLENNITGNTVTGTSGTRVNVSPADPFQCLSELKQGFNIMSFPCISTYTSRTEFFDAVINGTNNTYAFYEYTGNTGDLWKVYNPNLPSYVVQDLRYLNREKGYIVIMNKTDYLNYSGYLPESPTIDIKRGWNLVGYPSNETKILPNGINSINNSFRVIEAYYNDKDGKQGYYYYYNNFSGNLTELKIYHGYWINSSSGSEWNLN